MACFRLKWSTVDSSKWVSPWKLRSSKSRRTVIQLQHSVAQFQSETKVDRIFAVSSITCTHPQIADSLAMEFRRPNKSISACSFPPRDEFKSNKKPFTLTQHRMRLAITHRSTGTLSSKLAASTQSYLDVHPIRSHSQHATNTVCQ